MKRFSVSGEVCKKYGITIRDFLYLLFTHSGGSSEKSTKLLLKEGLIAPFYRGMEMSGYSLMDRGKALVDDIILESRSDGEEMNRIEFLSNALREIFPEGRKEGTALYWKGNSKEIANRIMGFFAKFGNYTDEEIINATQRYVDSFLSSGSLQNMRLLKYFIWKRVDTGGTLEDSSDLLSFIENADDENFHKDDWTSQLR